ncbi:hypothetical protein CVT24_004817 [Panaeolus cyanescens]|uniref:Glycosyltransferase family 28 N-terminal domain-containing protein n=1 Tax=Panaeolus cyanescens TaxID=181874 RepID=A0A409VQ64_9AGAR|nr:hypothetical protein CVT24_004817 [Panaeolus cyanescens]
MPSLRNLLPTRKKKSSSDKEHSLDSTISDTLSTKSDDSSSLSTHYSSENPGPKENHPLISTLYKDASDFEKVLYHSGCIDKTGVCPKGTTGFADLVGRDLNDSEKANVDRDAQICATLKSWLHHKRKASSTSILSNDVTDSVRSGGSVDEDTTGPSPSPVPGEREERTSDCDSGSTTSTTTDASSGFTTDATSVTSATSDLSQLEVPHIYRVSTNANSALEKLKPEDIISILEREFGVLASPDQPEKLLLETDGCLLHDVAIVGVIHLTTHRLTFHATLLATRPDMKPSENVLRSGAGIIHRTGLRAKKRVWFELTHDMISIYPSSKEEDKIRPLSTLLLAHIDDILPEDPKHPRIVKLDVKPFARMKNDYAELESVESARVWRREITAAVFAYRHQRADILADSSPETNGVKVSIPLHLILDTKPGPCGDEIPSLVCLRIALSASDADNEEAEGGDTGEGQAFSIGPVTTVPFWDDYLDIVIANAKKRRIAAASPDQSAAIVDFGPYNFLANSNLSAPNYAMKEELAIRLALGIPRGVDVWYSRARLYRTVMCTGYFAITPNSIGFWCQNVTQRDLRYRVPIEDLKQVKKFHWNFLGVEGLSLGIIGRADFKLVFKTVAMRDEAYRRIYPALEALIDEAKPEYADTLTASPPESTTLAPTTPTQDSLNPVDVFAPVSRSIAAASVAASSHSKRPVNLPKVINIPPQMLIRNRELHFVCLTIGSRGDVQPYIALGLGLMKEGHRVTIVTHEEYKPWIEKFGIGHRSAGGDPAALMKLSVENKMFSPDFFKQSLSKFRPWLDASPLVLRDSWSACQDADVLLESPSAMAGVHIAEALKIPYIRTFTMPWTKTTEFPHALLSAPVDSPTFNSTSYILFSNVIWAATSGHINRWRRECLRLEATEMGHVAQSKINFIYNFSKVVVPKPLDWPEYVTISGYWFLDDSEHNWTPPEALTAWMRKAEDDGKPIVYIGFGSITVPNPQRVTSHLYRAVVQSGVRAIITKGWSARLRKDKDQGPEIEPPPECFVMDSIPHDWLFPRIQAALQ